jgi:hypothetical protein
LQCRIVLRFRKRISGAESEVIYGIKWNKREKGGIGHC